MVLQWQYDEASLRTPGQQLNNVFELISEFIKIGWLRDKYTTVSDISLSARINTTESMTILYNNKHVGRYNGK